jgi:hypothetical protein
MTELWPFHVTQIDSMVRAAVVRAGYSPMLVPELRDMVCFHILMSNENITPARIGLLIEAFMPGMAEALAEEAKAAGLSLTISDTWH